MRFPAALALLLLLPLSPAGADSTSPAPAAGTTPGIISPVSAAPAPATPLPVSPAPAAEATAIPEDADKSWTVAFSALSAAGLSPQNAYLAFSIPLLLRDRVSGLPSHTFSDEDRLVYASAVVTRELRSASQTLVRARQDRDALLFASPSPGADSLAAAEVKLRAAADRRDFLRFLDPADVSFPEEKPLAFKDGPGAGKLFDPPRFSPLASALTQDVDLLVGGSIREVQGYMIVDLWACEPAREGNLFTFRDAVLREGLYASLEEAASGLTRAMLGREWAALTVVPDPPDSVTEVDGKAIGSGRITSLYLTPGTREIRVSAPGFEEKTVTVELAPSEQRTVTVSLEKRSVPSIALASDPPGADVYADSIWTGRTPLILARPADRERIQVVSHGFYQLPLSVGPASPQEITVQLQPDKGSREARQRQARDAFYTSFAYFLLSLPIPFFCYSLAVDEAQEIRNLQASPANTLPAQETAYWAGNVYYYSYLGGLGLSGSLLVWMVVNLFTYVTAATRTAG
jgi:hypothetical protein